MPSWLKKGMWRVLIVAVIAGGAFLFRPRSIADQRFRLSDSIIQIIATPNLYEDLPQPEQLIRYSFDEKSKISRVITTFLETTAAPHPDVMNAAIRTRQATDECADYCEQFIRDHDFDLTDDEQEHLQQLQMTVAEELGALMSLYEEHDRDQR